MNEWMEPFIFKCLADIPRGKYRQRTEKELRDHMETQYQALTETGVSPTEARSRVLDAMGDPEQLQREYKAAWERSLTGRLEALRHCLKTWAVGFLVMLGARALVFWPIGQVWDMAISLPAKSIAPQFKPIWNALRALNNSMFWWHLFPLVCALLAGAYYLARKFRTSRRPVWQISVGLSFHWAFMFAIRVWLEALDDHETFWEEVNDFLTYSYTFWYYSLTLALCVLLGIVFGRLFGTQSERRRELA